MELLTPPTQQDQYSQQIYHYIYSITFKLYSSFLLKLLLYVWKKKTKKRCLQYVSDLRALNFGRLRSHLLDRSSLIVCVKSTLVHILRNFGYAKKVLRNFFPWKKLPRKSSHVLVFVNVYKEKWCQSILSRCQNISNSCVLYKFFEINCLRSFYKLNMFYWLFVTGKMTL